MSERLNVRGMALGSRKVVGAARRTRFTRVRLRRGSTHPGSICWPG